jgi:hypothetical protein
MTKRRKRKPGDRPGRQSDVGRSAESRVDPLTDR